MSQLRHDWKQKTLTQKSFSGKKKKKKLQGSKGVPWEKGWEPKYEVGSLGLPQTIKSPISTALHDLLLFFLSL